jgi:hypothetical protein
MAFTELPVEGAEINSREREFFERKIRPIFVEHCYKCHSVDAEKLRGELLLDSRWGWQKGGESGAVILPGNPDESLLISALQYDKFEMPPKAKLPTHVIADFYEWIKMGAPDPREKKDRVAKKEAAFDIGERKDWWSLKPLREVPVPEVTNADWARSDYDRFLLAELEKKGWNPSKPAERTSWLRRVTYDLTGLPPSVEEVKKFLSDEKDGAHQRVVDRLLGSDHFGEQWARHWMDLVRYAETKAFEADYPMPNVYQYRDYLIRAFNSDLPYDRFVKEGIAGDLLEARLNPETEINESVIGPGYLYLTDGQHGPPDIHADEARIFDDMIDVVGKTFLSQTIACARCHDHKFDAITTKDYYSLYGVMASSRIDYADINSPKKQKVERRRLRSQKLKIRGLLAGVLAKQTENVAEDLRAVRDGKISGQTQKRLAAALEKKPNGLARVLASLLGAKNDEALRKTWKELVDQKEVQHETLGGLGRADFGEWQAAGRSFELAPRPPGDFIVAVEGDKAVTTFVGGRPAAGHLSSRFAGALRSPTFRLAGDSVRVRVKGKNVRVSLYVRHYELVGRGPTTGGTTKVINTDRWQTVSFGTRLWVGEPAYIEVQHNGGEVKFDWSTGKHVDGAYAVVESAVNNTALPGLSDGRLAWGISGTGPTNRDELLDFLTGRIDSLAESWRNSEMTMEQNDLLVGLFEAGIVEFNLTASEELKKAVETYRAMQKELPVPTYVRSLSDGPGADEPVYIRGSHKNLSKEPNPRHFLDGLNGEPFKTKGSGRLEWAEALVSKDNPLTPRVMVNRVWHHLFGRGLVASVDDFGHMGDTPSHPELLDFMASKFVREGWSVKRLIRELVLSSAYRMSSEASQAALEEDPNNIYIQRMAVRRLQAEGVRDTLLAVSGRLDSKLYGPSLRGDGGNRRSVYIQLRRRYMPEFLMTFDLPNSTEPFGRRNITAGPAQSLAMMNGPEFWRAAEEWAKRISASGDTSFAGRMNLLHLQAFGRAATARELEWGRSLLLDYGVDESSVGRDHWKQICHTMLNRKELIYVY